MTLAVEKTSAFEGIQIPDMGLTPAHCSAHERFEVDGANAARHSLPRRSIAQRDIDTIWAAIAARSARA